MATPHVRAEWPEGGNLEFVITRQGNQPLRLTYPEARELGGEILRQVEAVSAAMDRELRKGGGK